MSDFSNMIHTTVKTFPTGADAEVSNRTDRTKAAKEEIASVGQNEDTKETASSKSVNTLDSNKANNARNQAAQDKVTGNMTLVGVPILKAGYCVNILNVGPRASGKWYVKDVHHEWDAIKGYTTQASLLRSQLPEGGSSQSSNKMPGKTGTPVIMSADIYKKGKLKLKPRDLDAEVQDTFTYGDDDHRLISFSCSFHKQEKKGKDRGVSGPSHLIDKKKQPFDPNSTIDSNIPDSKLW